MTGISYYPALLQFNFLHGGGKAMPATTTSKKIEILETHAGPVITDRELGEYLSISAVATEKTGHRSGIESFSIHELSIGKFQLSMDLTFKGTNCLLITTRKTPRIWRDLHSLLEYVRSLGFSEAPVTIQLQRKSNETPVDAEGKTGST